MGRNWGSRKKIESERASETETEGEKLADVLSPPKIGFQLNLTAGSHPYSSLEWLLVLLLTLYALPVFPLCSSLCPFSHSRPDNSVTGRFIGHLKILLNHTKLNDKIRNISNISKICSTYYCYKITLKPHYALKKSIQSSFERLTSKAKNNRLKSNLRTEIEFLPKISLMEKILKVFSNSSLCRSMGLGTPPIDALSN